jgi:hypothetical protein
MERTWQATSSEGLAWSATGESGVRSRSPFPPGLPLAMKPSTDRESAIAGIVDQLDTEGRLDPSRIDEIIAILRFIPSEADNEFLVRYLQWRMANPIMPGA